MNLFLYPPLQYTIMSTVTAVLQSLAPQSWYWSQNAGSALVEDTVKEPQAEKPEKTLGESLRPLITHFVEEDLEYTPRHPRDNRALWKAADNYAKQTGVPRDDGSRSTKIFQTGVMYAAVSLKPDSKAQHHSHSASNPKMALL